jgi:hypothetical protein
MKQNEVTKLGKRINELEAIITKQWETNCVLIKQLQALGVKKIYVTRKALRAARRKDRKP